MAQIVTSNTASQWGPSQEREWAYNALDCAVTAEIHDNLMKRIEEEGADVSGVYEFERALCNVSLQMEFRGLRVDLAARRQLVREFKKIGKARMKEMDRFVKIVRQDDRLALTESLLKASTAYVLTEKLVEGETDKELRKEGRKTLTAMRRSFKKLKLELLNTKGFKWAKAVKPSSKQLQDLIYGHMGVAPMRNKKGIVSMDEETRRRLKKKYPKVRPLLELVDQAADDEKQIEVLQTALSPDGRMRATFSVGQTVTGRWSSSKDVYKDGTNLQNQDPRLRVVYTPDYGYTFINADLSQAESCCIAYLAQDEAYIDAHLRGNVHVTAGKIFWPELGWTASDEQNKALMKQTPCEWIAQPDPKPGQDASTSLYDISKRNQHGLNYGLTPSGLNRHLGCGLRLAEGFFDQYHSCYPGISRYHQEVREEIEKFGELTTPLGRQRVFFGRSWEPETIRKAIAHVPQSMTSDILKIALLRIWWGFDPSGVQVLLENHDSILMQSKNEDMDFARDYIYEAFNIPVPVHGRTMTIPVEITTGSNWRDLK